MTYVYALDERRDLPPVELVALLGGKGAGLAVMATELGLPVPPGFTITTQACRAYFRGGWPDGLDGEVAAHVRRLEAVVGRRFGDGADPLLVSVRSGAPVSMPGMMDTILDLGLTEAAVAGLAAASGDAAFAADCRARFVEMFTRIVGVPSVPDEPWLQLEAAIRAVFDSWNGERARAYRRREGIPDDLGTAVTVQAMVFGNRGRDSATGVLFTRNPATGEPTLYGDVLFGAQGEDVVSGIRNTEPLAVLDERLPVVAVELHRIADALERHYADLCDIEFTIEEGRLWILQVRVGKRSPQAALRIAHDMAAAADFPLTRETAVLRVVHHLADPPRISSPSSARPAPLATGLPASPGVASGPIVTSAGAAIAAAEGGEGPILVRPETSPEDVAGMARAVGILTARGGLASHAAVVARGWGIPAVVGAEDVEVSDSAVRIGSRSLTVGETITVDGNTGEVFAGVVARVTRLPPEVAALRAWAAESGIAIAAPLPAAASETLAKAGVTDVGPGRAPDGPAVIDAPSGIADDVVRALSIKGTATADGLAPAVGAPTERVGRTLDELASDSIVEGIAGAFRLTTAGAARADKLLAADRDRLGTEDAGAALDAFVALDQRMKETVTAWQLKKSVGEPIPNDHTDATYDALVLDRLAALDVDAATWLATLSPRLARLAAYRSRLDEALRHVREGDTRYVASPRVDSYHGIWFELHEDLIRLAARERSDEVAAGRA